MILYKCVVIRIAPAAYRRLDAGLCEAFGVANREILHAPVAMMHQSVRSLVLPLADGLLEGIEGEIGSERARDSPAHDPAAEDVDDEGDVDEATPGGHIREVRDPELIGAFCREVAFDQVQRAICSLVRDRGLECTAPDGAL